MTTKSRTFAKVLAALASIGVFAATLMSADPASAAKACPDQRCAEDNWTCYYAPGGSCYQGGFCVPSVPGQTPCCRTTGCY